MSAKTEGESAFEAFCLKNGLLFKKIVEGVYPTPDYLLIVNGITIYVEIKQIDRDADFTSALMKRIPGSHVRAKINDARNQVRAASHNEFPTILLVYNNLDPLQMFGTQQHDFISAMYGDLTVLVSRGTGLASDVFHGWNKAFREGKNESFSAVGKLYRDHTGIGVHLYENMYARVPLNYHLLPHCIKFNRVELRDVQDA